jgi:hypothetical protein
VFDFFERKPRARKSRKLEKRRICWRSQAQQPTFQQSYPQAVWIARKTAADQGAKAQTSSST